MLNNENKNIPPLLVCWQGNYVKHSCHLLTIIFKNEDTINANQMSINIREHGFKKGHFLETNFAVSLG